MKQYEAIMVVAVAVLVLASSRPPVKDTSVRTDLPGFRTIPAARASELTPASGYEFQRDYADWPHSEGNDTSSRYSELTQIDGTNIGRLEVAWIYHSKDGAGNIECNQVIVHGVMYAPAVGGYIVAINGSSGKEIWRYKPGGRAATRGLAYWKGDARHEARVFCQWPLPICARRQDRSTHRGLR